MILQAWSNNWSSESCCMTSRSKHKNSYSKHRGGRSCIYLYIALKNITKVRTKKHLYSPCSLSR
jgi:hypothetical protein